MAIQLCRNGICHFQAESHAGINTFLPLPRVTKAVCVEMVPPFVFLSDYIEQSPHWPIVDTLYEWGIALESRHQDIRVVYSKAKPCQSWRVWLQPEVGCSNTLNSILHPLSFHGMLFTLLWNTVETLKMNTSRHKQRDGYEFITPPLYSPS